eukprot:gene8860-809_t
MVQNIRVKLYYGENIRRFTISTTTKYEEILEIVKGFCPKKFEGNKTPVFQYLDEEDDYVTFTTEVEWNEAILHHNVSEVLRLKMKGDKKVEQKKTKKTSSAIPGIKNVQNAKDGKWDFATKEGDLVLELNSKQIDDFLKGNNVTLDSENLPQEEVVHYHIICDQCNKRDIKGIRYQCLDCEDYDLCQDCFKTSTHFNRKHNFEGIKKSVFHKQIPFTNVMTHIIDEDNNTVHSFENSKQEEIKEEKVELQSVEEKEEKVEEPIVKVEKVEELEQYSVHYQILENMGFTNKSLSTFLLNKYKGNLQKVVDEYLTLQ